MKIDANRNGVGTTYITEVAKAADGSFYNKVVKTVPNITQTLGLAGSRVQEDGPGLARRARLPAQLGRLLQLDDGPRSLRLDGRSGLGYAAEFTVPAAPWPPHRPPQRQTAAPAMRWRSAG